jgi:DNA processing protein
LESKEKLKYLFYLTKVKNLGNVRIKNILSYCKEARNCFELSKRELKRIEGIDEKTSNEIIKSKVNFKKFEAEFEQKLSQAEKEKIQIVCISDKEYPANLKRIYDAPIFLYLKGRLFKEDKYSLSVVGTRYPTDYGMNVCERLVKEISKMGIPIISGLARGIDSMSHRVALQNDNITYSVLGCGVDVVYPKENKSLYNKIIEKGAILSEFDIGVGPDKVNFPKRNRIISGISVGTLIVETGLKGGSLITAGFALDQSKEVFAIPGYIYSKKSEGSNELIKNGQAKLVSNVDDILDELSYKLKPILKKSDSEKEQKQIQELNIFEKKIFDVLDLEPIHIDEISEKTEMSISDCLVNLLSLEFKGFIRQIPGKNFIKL